MKLVCFPNFAAGGLVCEILNPIDSVDFVVGITFNHNVHHNLMKIGDNGKVYREFDEAQWQARLLKVSRLPPTHQKMWLGTHCHPSCIPEKYLNQFDEVMAITTETRLSKYYRFLRYCHDHVIGKQYTPETIAHFVMESFESNPRCINVEFQRIVDGTWATEMNLNNNKYLLWRELNSFLYIEQPELKKIFDSIIPDDQNS